MEKVRALLVEDDEDDYLLARGLFDEAYGGRCELQWVRDYNQALEIMERNEHDIYLLDYRLGAHTGLELLREALARRVKAPIILLTGQGDQEVDIEAMKSGAADFLIKGQITADLLERSIRYSIEQRRMEEERIRFITEQEARTQAEAANRAKDEFLGMVSHELRTPLNAMLGWIQVLRKSGLDTGTAERALDSLERNAMAQAKLIEDLLDISRIINNNLRLELRPVNPASVIEAAIETMRPSADAKSIEIESRLEASIKTISGDPDRLQQSVVNLLSNAIKFTPEGGKIYVCLGHIVEEAGNWVEIKVSDTGCGIKEDILPHVFDRYRQAHNTPTGRTGGLGLGLAIVRQLIELHGGSVRAESEGEGKGATFIIRIPAEAMRSA